MEDDKHNQDLVVDNDGSMSQGVNIKVNSQEGTSSEPVINDIEAPPEPTVDNNNVVSESVTPELAENADASNEVESNVGEVSVESESESSSSISEPIVAEPPVAEASAISDPFSPMPLSPATPVVAQSMSNNELSKPKEHRKNKKLALIVTLLLATLLAGVAIYLFMSAEDNAKEVSTPNLSSQQMKEIDPATAEDIDQAVTEIDETVQSIDNSTNLNEETVSDSTLGL